MAYCPACAQLHMCHNQTETVIPTHNSAHNDSGGSVILSYLLFFSLFLSLKAPLFSLPLFHFLSHSFLYDPPTYTQYPNRPTHSSIVFWFLHYVLFSHPPPPHLLKHTHTLPTVLRKSFTHLCFLGLSATAVSLLNQFTRPAARLASRWWVCMMSGRLKGIPKDTVAELSLFNARGWVSAFSLIHFLMHFFFFFWWSNLKLFKMKKKSIYLIGFEISQNNKYILYEAELFSCFASSSFSQAEFVFAPNSAWLAWGSWKPHF